MHGGPDKATNAYPEDYFAIWKCELGVDFSAGAFGENVTTRGALDSDVCIGDIFRGGGILVQVSQPRQPCWMDRRRGQRRDARAQNASTARAD